MAALTDAGLFRMFVPASLGGGEADPETFLEVIEDGLAGRRQRWLAPRQCGAAWRNRRIPTRGRRREIFGRDPGAVLSLTLAPPGRAVQSWRAATG